MQGGQSQGSSQGFQNQQSSVQTSSGKSFFENKIFLIAISVFVFIVGMGLAYLFIGRGLDSKPPTATPSPKPNQETPSPATTTPMPSPYVSYQSITLTRDGDSTTATVTRSIIPGRIFMHIVAPNLPQPSESETYQVWLFSEANEPTPFGTLSIDNNGNYATTISSVSPQFLSFEDVLYNRIAITQESTLDDTPGEIILEGNFTK